NMQEEDLVFTPSESTTSLQLIWGNATPNVEFANPEKKIFSPNELATFNWTTQYAQLVDYYNLYLENDDLSIPLAFNVSNFQQEFNWVVQQITQENLRLRIECVMREGDVIEYYSSFKVGIVPNEIFITADSGWSLIGHPFQDENMSIEEMYSPSAQFYRYAMNLFFEETVLNPYRGYWLHSDEEIYTILDSVTTYETEQSIELQYGWNIIPNPHQIQYDIEQLQLNYLGNNYDFYAAIQEGIIFPDVYRNEDGFAKTSILEKQKSYYLYSAYNDVFLIFDPYYSPDNGFDLPKDWFVKVSAIQENIDGGHILVGSAPTSTDGFDYLYDSYLPTAKPFDIQLNMGLLNENIPDEKMYSNFIENVEDFSDVNLEWEANVEVDSLAPINFTGICDNLPENVNCYLVFEDTNIHITNNCLKTYYPETNSIDFIVRITTDELDNFEDVITPEKLSVMNFPNPFNPTTKIKFTIPEKAEVSINIFNIKGQQVRKLVNSQFTAGQYSVVWDGKDNFEKQVSSGVYFYKINSGEEHIVRKMLMMK
ncbi:MAG: T9SS type A sorting domain-containing protein, partial [Candidatus Cloacimonadota bacterium]|nr:T9SS type A sorting domain-containing protein [Candidatus Cloacimonadota bacterium]